MPKIKQPLLTISCIVAIIAMNLLATSCGREYFTEDALVLIPGVERHITPSATLPQPLGMSQIDGSQNVSWKFGNAININGINAPLISIENNTMEAEFSDITLYANSDGDKDNYWAVYPTTIAGAYNGSLPADFTSPTSLTVHLPATQIVNTANDTMKGFTYMASRAAVSSNTSEIHFQMRNLCAILELDITPRYPNNTQVDSIMFTSSNATLAGTFTVSDDPTNPTITPTAGSTYRLVVKFSENGNNYINIYGGKKVRVFLPPMEDKNLNMKLYGNGGRYMEKDAASVTFARNKYYFSEVTFDTVSTGNLVR